MNKMLFMAQRNYCLHCLYPLNTCLCSAVSPLNNKTVIDIIQHPSEQKAAKNTARLVALCAANTNIWLGEAKSDFAELLQQLNKETRAIYVVYPNGHSQAVEPLFLQKKENTQTNNTQSDNAYKGIRLIFLDGTWKKAYKLWLLNPWLQAYPSIHFTAVSSQYIIRKAPSTHCLSTLEAVAYCLQGFEPVDVQPLYNCLHKMQATFIAYRMPYSAQK